MTIKNLPLEHLFHKGKPFLTHSAQLDYPEARKKKNSVKQIKPTAKSLKVCSSLATQKTSSAEIDENVQNKLIKQ